MKPFIVAFLAAVSLLGLVGLLQAGVVIEEVRVENRKEGPRTYHRTIMIEGKKRKVALKRGSTITDLDTGTLILVNGSNKSYVEFPDLAKRFRMGHDDELVTVDWKKTGEHRTVAGYPCDVYSGPSVTPGWEHSVTACFSSQAPGAADFTRFQKLVAAQVVAQLKEKPKGPMPEGVPLSIDETIKVKPPRVTSPGEAEQFVKRPPVVVKTTVTKIHAEKLSPDNFKPPEDYRHNRRFRRRAGQP